jgi:predicted ribosomally synthesized peptide with SipW-like signal peptide
MKRRYIILSLLAVVLVLGLSVGHAWSYFTDNTMAEGSVTLSIKPDTTITEEWEPETQTKSVIIHNKSSVVPVWVRARAYIPKQLNGKASGTNWTGSSVEDWFVYDLGGQPLPPNGDTQPLNVSFTWPDKYDPATNPTGPQTGDELNIVIVYECLPASYDADGKPVPANWN